MKYKNLLLKKSLQPLFKTVSTSAYKFETVLFHRDMSMLIHTNFRAVTKKHISHVLLFGQYQYEHISRVLIYTRV